MTGSTTNGSEIKVKWLCGCGKEAPSSGGYCVCGLWNASRLEVGTNTILVALPLKHIGSPIRCEECSRLKALVATLMSRIERARFHLTVIVK